MYLNELEDLAKAAIGGEWRADGSGRVVLGESDQAVAECYGPDKLANARFIAAANPAAVLELADELSRALESDYENSHTVGEYLLVIGWLQDDLEGERGRASGVAAEVAQLKAENEALRKALREVMTQVDGNIREAVRDCVNGHNDVQDIYGYCDAIEAVVGGALLSE